MTVASRMVEELRDRASEDFKTIRAHIGCEHPRASPVPTGGRIASPDQINDVRSHVLESVGSWVNGQAVARTDYAAFDGTLGRALHHSLDIVPADAAHPEVWNFLTLVVFPDIAVTRFPALHEKRLLGGPRNVLRRTWYRYEVLGEILFYGSPPLGEDELVGLLERTAVARNRSLVRVLAKLVLKHSGGEARSEFARTLFKRARYKTGPLMLDVLSESEIEAVILGNVPMAPVTLTESKDTESPADLKKQFDSAMSELNARMTRETDYGAPILTRMILEYGGYEAAKKVVNAPYVSDRFAKLWSLGRLDLAVESLVLDIQYESIFEDQILSRAKHRLDDHRGG